MNKKIIFFILNCFVIFSSTAKAEHTRVTNPNSIGVEVLGRGLLYGIQFDRVLNDDMAAGIAFGAIATKTAAGLDSGRTASFIPVFMNYYFAREAGSIYLTAGATIVTNANDLNGLSANMGNLTFTSSAVLGTVGVGYESRSDNGFLFRVCAYGIIGGSTIVPWGGATFGFAF